MKKFLKGLGILLCITLAVIVLAFRMGWLTLDMVLHRVPAPSPSPKVVVQPSTAPRTQRDHNILRVAIDDRASTLPLLALSDFIKSHGNDLRIDLVQIPDPRVRWQMLAADRIDIAFGTLDSAVLGQIRHDAGTVIFKLSASSGMDVLVATKEIQDLHALAGKRVAVVSGAGGSYLLGFFLDRVGLSPSEVHVVETEDPRDSVQLLQKGLVQAAWLWDPHLKGLTANGLHVLGSTTPGQEIVEEVCVASHSAFNDRNGAILTFTRHWFEFETLLKNNPGLGRELVARAARVPAGSVVTLLGGVRYFDLVDNQKLENEDIANQARRIQEFWKIMGTSNATLPIDLAHGIRVDVTREIEMQAPSSIFGPTNGQTPHINPNTSPDPTTVASPAPQSENSSSPEPDDTSNDDNQ